MLTEKRKQKAGEESTCLLEMAVLFPSVWLVSIMCLKLVFSSCKVLYSFCIQNKKCYVHFVWKYS